jgi:hypothetical protein
MTTVRARVVLILGMHRSGTSLLARMLAAQGLPLGRHLLTDPMPDNPHGYWEQAEIVAIQEGLLRHFKRDWWGARGLEPLPEGWRAAPATRRAQGLLSRILAREMAAAGPVWGFKDPRTLRFLPLWDDILAEQDLEPVPVLALRAPAAVAASLALRNRLPRARADALWAFNTIEALNGAAGRLAAVVDYDAWFTRPEETAHRLQALLGLPGPPHAACHLIDPALRHGPRGEPPAPSAFEALHRALIARAPLPPDPARPILALPEAQSALAALQQPLRGLHGLFRDLIGMRS